jgi:predicted DNA-binding protein
MGKKSIRKIAAKDADQYMLRLPPGLRDRLARRAAENGRSMNTEIVEAIEQHLTGADRVTQLWEFYEKHQENIETIPVILSAILAIEANVPNPEDADIPPPRVLSHWHWQREMKKEDAYVASLPLVTPEQVQIIKALLKGTDSDEKRFLRIVGASRIEDIRGFERAASCVGERWSKGTLPLVTPAQVQIIKALLKEIGVDEERFLALMEVPRLEDIRGFERAMTIVEARRRSRRT